MTSGGGATALIVAAGAGERLASGVPKALVDLEGEPLVVHAARSLAAAERIDGVVVVLPSDATDAVLDQVGERLRDAGVVDAVLTRGAATRQGSVSAGLAALDPSAEVVAVHDAARALVTPQLVDRVVAALEPPWDAVAPGVPVADTVKLVDGARHAVLRTVDRQGLWAVQTPQVARRITLERVHARIAGEADAATDDLSLVERAGGRVRLVAGERRNFKVTVPEDLVLAAALVRGLRT